MPQFSPVFDVFLALLAILCIVAGAAVPAPPTLRAYLVIFGTILLGYQLTRIYIALHLLERRATLFDPEPGGGKEARETDWPQEVKDMPDYENVRPIRRAA
jgi:hypothetical protein